MPTIISSKQTFNQRSVSKRNRPPAVKARSKVFVGITFSHL